MRDSSDEPFNEALIAWLAASSCTPDSLADWLQGYGIPAVGHDDEPYLWLLRAIPHGEKRPLTEKRLSICLATLLFEIASRQTGKTVDRLPQLLYNGFMLAASLNSPDLLFEPLHNFATHTAINNSWLGVDLRDTLRIALTHNQIDHTLLPDWRRLLFQERVRLFPGTSYDAFEGIVMMPVPDGKSGEIWIAAVGEALKHLAGILEEDWFVAREKFQHLIDRAAQARLYPSTLDRDFVLIADRFGWPAWAIECLPNLYVRLNNDRDESAEHALVWTRLASLLPETASIQIIRTLCSGSVVEVRWDATAARYAHLIALEVEPLRRQNPYFSASSVLGTLNDAVVMLQQTASARGEHDFADTLRQKQVELARELKIAV